MNAQPRPARAPNEAAALRDHHRQVARFEHAVRADLRARRWLRWHSFLLASTCLLAMWGVSAALMHAGIDTLALRWPLAFAAAYAVFIGLLHLWCRWLLSHDEFEGDVDPGLVDLPRPRSGADPVFRSGEGGDFGGGGASGSFEAGDAVEGATKVAGQAFEAAASADEGIVIAVPLAVVVGVGALLAGGLGVAVFGLFGIEVLLGVAVEIAIASAGGALAYRARREGWLAHALSRTLGPAAIVLVLAGALGATIDHWLPQAHSLPQALRALGR
jgi:hypothetical protein